MRRSSTYAMKTMDPTSVRVSRLRMNCGKWRSERNSRRRIRGVVRRADW